MIEPLVDVVIAVHTTQRPIRRAVSSVLENRSALRVTVVCHGIPVESIAANLGDLATNPRVRLLAHSDGIPSPAGPFNAGLEAATAPFTSVMGSDDELEPGALDSWLALQARDHADVVIPRLRLVSGGVIRSPLTRPRRTRGLDGVKDRLAYRTAQLGLVSRSRFPQLRFATGLRSGEDIDYGLELWFSRARIGFDRSGPAYVIHDEGDDRTSTTVRSIDEDFAFLHPILDSPWAVALDRAQKQSIAVKLMRTQVIEAIALRSTAWGTDEPERESLRAVIRHLVEFAPTATSVLSRRDNRIIRLVLQPGSGSELTAQLAREFARRSVPYDLDNVLSGSILRFAHRESPLRFLAAYLRAT